MSEARERFDARQRFLDLISAERDRQTELWGEQTHSGHAWAGILGEEYGEFTAAVNDGDPAKALLELTHVAAVACAAFEQAQAGHPLLPAYGTWKGHGE